MISSTLHEKKQRLTLARLLAMLALVSFNQTQAQTSQSATNTETASRTVIVDKVVANPEKFKGPINVSGRVARLGGGIGLFALSCEDECFSMPVKFSGAPPKPGSDVVVHGQLTKESNGRYVFNAENVIPKK